MTRLNFNVTVHAETSRAFSRTTWEKEARKILRALGKKNRTVWVYAGHTYLRRSLGGKVETIVSTPS